MLMCSILLCINAHETAGAARTRSFPAPFVFKGANEFAKLGRNMSRERERLLSYPPLEGEDESTIQFLVMPENPIRIERNPALAREIRLDVRSRGDAVAQIDQAWDLALERLHSFRERIAQAFDELEHREVDIGQPPPGDIGAAVLLEQPFEIAEIFR